MHLTHILALGVSALSLLEGVTAVPQQRGGGSRQQDNQEGQQVSMSATGRTAQATSTADDAVKNNNNNNNGNGNNVNQAALNLDPENVQTGSQSDGNPDATAGQSASLTDDANFINFCSGKTLTNGLQNTAGSCNGIPMGDIPAKDRMISSIITNPAPGDNIDADTDFNIDVQVDNLQAGTFTNPDSTYYAAPQQVKGGQVVGHTHVTVQSLGNSIVASNPPDAATFVFFKGINDDGNGNGGLTAAVAGGLPAGAYRVCTMTSSSNHQPVLMPVAQRGAQDDCTKFTVGGAGGNNNGNNANNANNNNNNNNNANTGNNGNNANGNGNAASSSTAALSTSTTSTTSAAAAASSTATGRGRDRNGQGRRRTRFTAREFIV